MTTSEVSFSKSHNLMIMPIWSDWGEFGLGATGYNSGQAVGDKAVAAAHRLGIAAGVTLSVDIEAGQAVDASFIQGYYDTVSQANFTPGFYENPAPGEFGNAYCQAVGSNSAIGSNSVLWSSTPEGYPTNSQPTNKAGMPAYQPNKPGCANQTLAWQYCEPSTCGNSDPYLDEDEIQSNAHLWLPAADLVVGGQQVSCCLVY